MADPSIEEQLNEAREAVFVAIRNGAPHAEKNRLQEELGRLCSRQIVQRQMASEPKPLILKEMRK